MQGRAVDCSGRPRADKRGLRLRYAHADESSAAADAAAAQPRMRRSLEAERVAALSDRLRVARDPAHEPLNLEPWLEPLRAWQNARLARSFADLARQPRYELATRFFLDDLYGTHDMSWRDRELTLMLPTLTRWLPPAVLRTVGDAIELDLVSHQFDLAMSGALRAIASAAQPPALDLDLYGRAYRATGTPETRGRQIDLIVDLGRDLDRVVRLPMIAGVLRIARGPALAAGLGGMHVFLERGFVVFRSMRGADEFLAAVAIRERAAMRRLFGADPDPFRSP